MKNLLKLEGALQMSKKAQQSISGGYNYITCGVPEQCPDNWFCNGQHCVPCKYGNGTEPGC